MFLLLPWALTCNYIVHNNYKDSCDNFVARIDFKGKFNLWEKNTLKFHICYLFSFFCIHKKEVLDCRKSSTTCFRRIHMFWYVLNTIWPLLKNVCLSVCPSVFRSVCLSVRLQNIVGIVSQELMDGNWWNFIFSCNFMQFSADSILVYIP